MSERPIEEIIGWRRCGRCGTWRRPDWDDDCGTPAATVDDLAAWLNNRISWGSWALYHDCEQWYVDVDDEVDAPESHSTILAALEAAVRKVADA